MSDQSFWPPVNLPEPAAALSAGETAGAAGAAGAAEQQLEPYVALYLHIPFCSRRCFYCDFVSKAVASDDPEMDAYTEDLVMAIRRATRAGILGQIKTIYIGGGTPSFLGAKRLINLVYTLSLSLNLHADSEFSIEVNPDSLSKSLIRDLYSLGVNRFSVGVQSLVDSELKTLGRAHNRQTALEALSNLLERCENVSVDLICGIPGQTDVSWQKTLQEVLKLSVAHLSVYPLTLEPGTALAGAAAAGQIKPASDDQQAQMLTTAADVLRTAGFERYEVASYARPGFACQHNIVYWSGQPYLGLGRGAASMQNTPEGRNRLYEGRICEQMSLPERSAEDLMLGMRRACGVRIQAVKEAQALLPEADAVFQTLIADGLVKTCDDCYCATERGWLLSNQIFCRIWGMVA